MQPNQNSAVIALVLCAALLFSTGFFRAPEQSDLVRTKKFELVDDAGTVRASIKIEEGGVTMLRLFDGNGEIRVKLGAEKDGSGLILLDDKTNPGIHGLAKKDG